MSRSIYSPEFKEEAVRQVTERGYSVTDVAGRIGVSTHSLYKWVKAAKPGKAEADDLTRPGLRTKNSRPRTGVCRKSVIS